MSGAGMIHVVCAVGALIWWAATAVFGHYARLPREEADGLWLSDLEDGWPGVAMAMMKAMPGFIGAFVLVALVASISETVTGKLLWPFYGALAFALAHGLWHLWHVAMRLRMLASMAPGRLKVPAWPLAPLAVVELKFRRRLHRKAKLKGLKVQLVRYRRERVSRYGSKLVVESKRPVKGVVGRLRNGWLEATLPLEVPEPIVRESGIPGLRDFSELAPEAYWHLEIRPTFEGLPDEDAVFQLKIKP